MNLFGQILPQNLNGNKGIKKKGTTSFSRSSFVRPSLTRLRLPRPVHRDVGFPDQFIEI